MSEDKLTAGIQNLTSLLDLRDKQVTMLLEYIEVLETRLSLPLPEGNKEVGIV